MRYFQNTSWLMGEKLLRIVVGLFVGIWVARYLGPEQFGLLSYAQSFVFLFTAFATLGLDGIVVRELVRDETKKNALIGTAFGLKLIGAITTLSVLAFAVQLTSNDHDTNLLVFIIASATIFQSFNVIDFYYQSQVLSKYVALANTISLVLSSIIKIALILNNAGLVAFAMMTIFDMAVLTMGLIVYYKKISHQKLSNWSFEWPVAKMLFKDSWPLMLSGLVISVYMKIDQVMIKDMLNAEAVGHYAAAVRLSEAWYFIPMIITSSLFPAIINTKNINEKLYYLRLQHFYDLMVWMAIAIAVPVIFLSDLIIDLLYGSQYAQASSVLKIHILAGIFVFFGCVKGKWLITENLQLYGVLCTSIGAFTNVILNYIFIRSYGVTGAAFSTLISYGISTVGVSAFYSRDRTSLVMFIKSFNLFKYKGF